MQAAETDTGRLYHAKTHNMKEALRNILPLYRISKWKIILLGCVMLSWIAIHLPVFQNTASRLFFSFDINYLRQFDELGCLPAFFNNFFAQFQTSALGIFLTQFALILIYMACAYRIGGRYSLFMLPLWLVLMPSTQPAEQEMAFGLLGSLFFLAILFHWISYRESHKRSQGFYYEVFYLNYWIYYVLMGSALFFFFGSTALLFLGIMVIYRLIILFSSFKARGSDNVENASLAFGIYFITAVGITFVFPRFLTTPECVFQWTWIEWTAASLFIVAILGSLIQNTLKRNLHNPYPLSWLVLAIGIFLCAILVGFHRTPLKTAYVNISNACQKGDYARVVEIGTSFFEKYPKAEPGLTEAKAGMRASISAYTRLGLIMQGQLNQRFLEFRHIEEMQGMFPNLLEHTQSSDYAYARMYYELELYGSAIPVMNYTLDRVGYEQRLFELLIPIETATYQRRLLDKHIPVLKKSLGFRRFAKQWEKINEESITMGIPDGPSPVGSGLKLSRSQTAINQLVSQKVENRLFNKDMLATSWSNDLNTSVARTINLSRPLNLPVLEYYSMLCLLKGKIELAPALVSAYSKLEATFLPAYMQEAILLNSGILNAEKENFAQQKEEWIRHGFEGFRFDPQIVDRCWETVLYLRGEKPSPDAGKPYRDSYTYYYLTQINHPTQSDEPHTGPYCPNS